MSNVSNDQKSISDVASISKDAANEADRRKALDACLLDWAGDIGRLTSKASA